MRNVSISQYRISFECETYRNIIPFIIPYTAPYSLNEVQAEAERQLLAAALAHAANQRFLLLSESCAPLYPSHLVYAEALSCGRSRVNACRLGTWQDDMRMHLEKCAPDG